jgi:hypothetical protein
MAAPAPKPTQGKVSLQVELIIQEPGKKARRFPLGALPTPLRDPIIERVGVELPLQHPEQTCVIPQSGGYAIEASGTVPTGTKPARVWARCFPDPVLAAGTHATPDGLGAVSVEPVAGAWSFRSPTVVPGAKAEVAPGTQDNSTLYIWYEFAGSGGPTYTDEVRSFFGVLPGYGSCPPVAAPPVEFPLPDAATVHATFTGALSNLGTVALARGPLGWAALVPPAGILSFLAIGPEPHLLLLGLTLNFDVTGELVSEDPYIWEASGMAVGFGGGAFEVTVTE